MAVLGCVRVDAHAADRIFDLVRGLGRPVRIAVPATARAMRGVITVRSMHCLLAHDGLPLI
jgi:hypothetical protein